MSLYDTIAMILAGGQGSRLSILAEHRAKPAVPFGGIFRIIDFTISNVMHSHIPVLGVATQYKPSSLMDHISTGKPWGFIGRKHHAKILPPYTGELDSDWYAGTADAVYQNIPFIDKFDPRLVLVLSGDHIYKMDYTELIEFHEEKKADVTIAMQEVPWDEVHRFGVSVLNDDQRMVDFIEKSKDAPSNLASLGIYLFNRDFLDEVLREDAADKTSAHDFGKNIIPKIMKERRVYCYVFKGYWRDVGTLSAYWNTHQEILKPSSGLDLDEWRVQTKVDLGDLRNLQPLSIKKSATVHNSIIAPGCVIWGDVVDSILSPGVIVKKGARVEKSVIMNNTMIGNDAVVDYAILDKEVKVGDGCVIGAGDETANREAPHLLSCGITVAGKRAMIPNKFKIGKNCIIHPVVLESDYENDVIESGETIRPHRKTTIK